MTDTEVLVLGGGIAGCLTACQLADLGFRVAIVEQREQLMDGASRWNDGKVHFGYTYIGTQSLTTAALMQEGAGAFVPILERVIGGPVEGGWYAPPLTYVVDRSSLFDEETLWQRAQAVRDLFVDSLRKRPGLSLVASDGPLLERLDVDRATEQTGVTGITAAWKTNERQISPREVANRVRAAVQPRGILVIKGTVEAVTATGKSWQVSLDDGRIVRSGMVVNCLWESRALIDRQLAGVAPSGPPMAIRYKVSLFGINAGLGHLAPSTRILGAFGDVATFANGDAYLAWYPAAVIGRSFDGTPPTLKWPGDGVMEAATLKGLGLAKSTLEVPGASWSVKGGHIVAYGTGDITQRDSLLHTRDLANIRELRPGFFSVDTGKYTLGPWISQRAATLVAEAFRNRRVA